MNNVLGSFFTSYVERDKNVNFLSWLSEQLHQELPDMPSDEREKLVENIISGVSNYDKTLDSLNKATEIGLSKEEWLAGYITESYADVPFGEAGKTLQQVENDFAAGNARLMQDDIIDVDAVEHDADYWNEYNIKKTALDIGKQAVMSGLGVAMATMKQNMESGESVDVGNALGQALQTGMQVAKAEVKATMAGAIKVAVENNLTDILPVDTPVELICDIAGVAVEGADALFNVATGNITMSEALEKTGKASIAAAGRWCSHALKVKLTLIPYVGPIVVKLAGGLLEHLESPKFVNNVYNVVHDMAKATWEGIKESGRKIMNDVKNFAGRLFANA
jgi:hypothetical protein